jgi:hypothetical protein
MIRKSTPCVSEKLRCRQIGWHSRTDESVDDHKVGVAITQLGNAAPAVDTAYLDPAARR